jgi:NADH-quinone oxidoreductase subunit J
VATVVVYAGAILVTFLFVLMLAQPEGQAFYDRLSWEAMLSAITGAVVLGIVVTIVGAALGNGGGIMTATSTDAAQTAVTTNDADQADQQAAERDKLTGQHVAKLGGQLFSRHLIAVEVAGTLLLAALVGAVAIVAQGVEPRKNPAGPGRQGTQQGRASDA